MISPVLQTELSIYRTHHVGIVLSVVTVDEVGPVGGEVGAGDGLKAHDVHVDVGEDLGRVDGLGLGRVEALVRRGQYDLAQVEAARVCLPRRHQLRQQIVRNRTAVLPKNKRLP